MTNNPTSKIMDGYLAIILDEESHKFLLEKFPPLYQKVFAHHVTVAFKPSLEVYDEFKKYLGTPVTLRVCGYAKDEKAEAVLVETDILKGRQNHITLSTNGVPPFYSKTLLEKGYEPIDETFLLHGIFEFVEHKPR